MIWLDYREGSKELLAPLRKVGLPAEITTLDFGDIAFEGQGPEGLTSYIGVEYKKIGEFVQSIRSERLTGHQLLGMRDIYTYCWLLIEGEVLFDKQGRLLRRVGRRDFRPLGGAMGISELFKRELGLHLRGGLTPIRTRTLAESIYWIEALYRSWTDVAWDDHTSHLGIYRAPSLIPLSDVATAISAWPGIGSRVARAAEKRFKTIGSAATASVSEWADLTTVAKDGKARRLGDAKAKKIVNFLKGTT